MKNLLRLLGFLRPFAAQVALSVLVGAATVAASIGLLGTSAYLIAQAALHPSIAALQVAIVGVRFFGLSRAILRYGERLLTHNVNFHLLARLRTWFYRAIEPLAPARLIDYRGGDLLGRAVQDIDILENFYVRAVSPPLIALVVTVGISAFVGHYHLMLGGLLLAGLLLVGLILPLLAFWASRIDGRQEIARRAQVSADLVEWIQGASDLAAFGQMDFAIQRVILGGRAVSAAQGALGRAAALVNAFSVFTAGLTVWAVLWVGVPLVGDGIDGVALAVIVLLVMASFEAVNPLAPAAQQLSASLAAAERLFELADDQPVVTAPSKATAAPQCGALRIHNLSFRYAPEDELALQHFSLDLPSARRVALVGASGAGKSTVLNLLLRFWNFSEGEILLDGRDIRCYDPEDVRRWMVVIRQTTDLFAGSLRQNLLLAEPQASAADLDVAIAAAQLEEVLARLPDGLQTWVGERGVQLSAGERQRVALGRALLRLQAQPGAVLLLDEPTANLDAANEARFMAALRQACVGRSLLLVTHRLTRLDWLDEIVVLRAGQVIERGAPTDLLMAGGYYARLDQIQRQSLAY